MTPSRQQRQDKQIGEHYKQMERLVLVIRLIYSFYHCMHFVI